MSGFQVLATDRYGFGAAISELVNVHPETACQGRACVIHAPTDHHMRAWTLLWRDDRGIFERLCPEHGIGHPDPDQYAYWEETGQLANTIHGCCGCCARKEPEHGPAL
ncbi:hypothetical protein [Nocardia flavorosea]|uniref:Uncharacterized protein n=1 Tax=Nocardia flavorosea TaxID=53429 RepID=A0A846YL60_9NOCA|nr:hypothetical protein [Nocardia flavorosea]NKY60376.1 hypothetical protein [Nocardia flavorosea]